MIRIGINGLGRIGRCVLSHISQDREDMKVVKVNATGPADTHAHLLKYDSVHGRYPGDVRASADGKHLVIDNNVIELSATRVINEIDWPDVDVVLECTGAFNDGIKSAEHLVQGAKKVLISAPAKNIDNTIVYGVNHQTLTADQHVISNGSCTTNCLAPIAQVLNSTVGIEHGMMTTIHSYTGDQSTIDAKHKDLYRARAAAMSMIPTSTGAAKAVGLVLPELNGKLDGFAMRVPTPNVSAVDLKFTTSTPVTAEGINAIVKEAADTYMKGVIAYDDEPKVSIDFNHSAESCVFAPAQTKVVGNMVSILAWYDNEWGFSCRMADVTKLLASKL